MLKVNVEIKEMDILSLPMNLVSKLISSKSEPKSIEGSIDSYNGELKVTMDNGDIVIYTYKYPNTGADSKHNVKINDESYDLIENWDEDNILKDIAKLYHGH